MFCAATCGWWNDKGTSVSSDASVLTSYTHLGCFAFEVEADPFFSLVQMDGMTYHVSIHCTILPGIA